MGGDEHAVQIDEFTAGCMKFKGAAKGIDMVCLLSLSCRQMATNKAFMDFVEEELSALATDVHGLSTRLGLEKTTREGNGLSHRLGPYQQTVPIISTGRI